VGTFHQATILVGDHGRAADLGGRELLGTRAAQRFYQASDRWFFVGAAPSQEGALAAVCGLDRVDEASLKAVFATGAAADWVARLIAAGLGAHEVVRLPELFDNEYVVSTGLRIEQLSEEIGAVVMPGPAVTIDGRRLAAGRVVGAPGSDARSVLAEIDRADELGRLEARWVIQTESVVAGWPVP